MYNDISKHQQFIDDALNLLLHDITISNEIILLKLSLFEDMIKLVLTNNPWSYCDYIFDNYYSNSYFYNDILDKLANITIDEIKSYCNTLIKNSGSYVFVFGNLKKENIPNFDKLKTNFTKKIVKFPTIKIKKNVVIKHPNKHEKSNCVKISYFTGKFNPQINLYLLFVKLITMNMFFVDLRTTKQLGYLVQMFSSVIHSEYYIYQQVQSHLKCNEIIKHINQFNSTLIDNMKKIDLTKWKETVTNHLNKKETSIDDLYNKYNSEIINKTNLFDRNKLMLKYIDTITIDSLCQFITKFILNNQKKNILQIIGN
jgi:secreted Zn-dependent insulinase-like peptidase